MVGHVRRLPAVGFPFLCCGLECRFIDYRREGVVVHDFAESLHPNVFVVGEYLLHLGVGQRASLPVVDSHLLQFSRDIANSYVFLDIHREDKPHDSRSLLIYPEASVLFDVVA